MRNKFQIWISMFSYFKNRITTYFDVFGLNFSIETKIKTIFQISYFNLSKKKNEMALWVHGFFNFKNKFPVSRFHINER